MRHFLLIVILGFLFINLNAQKRASLNYYAEDVLNKINASQDQKDKIKEIRSDLDNQLREIKDDSGLAADQKTVKRKQAYNLAFERYNQVIDQNQQRIIRSLLHAIQEENVKNGLASFHESAHFLKRMELFKQSPIANNSTVFLGNSITEAGKWEELIPEKAVFNRGIGGDNTYGILARLNEIVDGKPEKVFLMIGINDIGSRLWEVSLVMNNYRKIVDQIVKGTPKTELFIQSLLPLNDALLKNANYKNKADSILKLNQELKKLSAEKKVKYIDLHKEFHAGNHVLDARYTKDGIHLLPAGYTLWVEFLRRNKYL